MIPMKAEGGLVYRKDGDGWTVVASCLAGAPDDEVLAETFASVPKMYDALRAAREAILYGEQIPGYHSDDELHALELIEEVLSE